MHYQILENYIIKGEEENNKEIKKLQEIIEDYNKTNINHTNNNINNNRNLISNTSIRRDDIDRPLRRPTTPMTNLSSTSNSQIFNIGKNSIASRLRNNVSKTPPITNEEDNIAGHINNVNEVINNLNLNINKMKKGGGNVEDVS